MYCAVKSKAKLKPYIKTNLYAISPCAFSFIVHQYILSSYNILTLSKLLEGKKSQWLKKLQKKISYVSIAEAAQILPEVSRN